MGVTEEDPDESTESGEILVSAALLESLLSEIDADEEANAIAVALRAGWDGTTFDREAALNALVADGDEE